MGRKRRGNGWTRAKKLPRVLESAPGAPILAPPDDGADACALPLEVAMEADELLVPMEEEQMHDECVPPTPEPESALPQQACMTPPQQARDECVPPAPEPERVLPPAPQPPTPVPLPRDDEVAATFCWRRPTNGKVLFPYHSPADSFRMIDMSRLADEFRQMFRRGEDSWCERVLVWLRRNKERVTLTFGELRAAAAAGHRNVMQLVRCYFETHDDAIPLIE